MKKIANRLLCFVTVFVMCLMFNTAVFAQGTTSISVSKSSVGVGDTTVVSVTASSSGTVTVKYTASLMNFIDCTASGFSYKGNTVTFSGTQGDIKFKAIAEGKACIIVSSSSCTGSSTTINVGSGSSESTADKPKEEEKPQEETEAATEDVPEDASETVEETSASTDAVETQPATAGGIKSGSLNAEGGFDIDGVSYVVSERYSDSEIPKGFKKVTLTIGQSTYNELTNGNITLLYLKPADKTEGKGEFYIYSENTGTVTKLSMLGSSNQYVMIATATEKPNPNMAEGSFSTDKGDFSGYNFEGSDFYYVYGFNENGDVAWYVYDTQNNTVSRADETALKMATAQASDGVLVENKGEDAYSPVESYQKKLEKLRLIVSALIIICVVLVFVIINLLIKKNKAEEDDIFDNDEQPIMKKKKSRRGDIFSSKSEDDIFGDAEFDEDSDLDYQEDEEMSDEDYVSDKHDESQNSSSNHRTTNSKSGIDIMDLNDL